MKLSDANFKEFILFDALDSYEALYYCSLAYPTNYSAFKANFALYIQ